MLRLLSLLAILPLITFAQSKKTSSTKPLLIESITTDTIKGKFKQILFSYDANIRVVCITHKKLTINTGDNKKDKLVETITEKQVFDYQDESIQPFTRTIYSFGYGEKSKKWILGSIDQQYFLYKNEIRVGDSTSYFANVDELKDWNWKNTLPKNIIGRLEQKNSRIYHEIDLTKPYSSSNVYKNQFKLTAQSNIGYEAVEHHYGNRGRDDTYYTFSNFDSKLNPLKQLNIANTLNNEKISFYSSEEGNREISWYFINQNNILDYFVTVDEQSSDFNDIVHLTYSYNQFNQPVHVKVFIKHVWHNGGEIEKKFQKNFTFRYKK
ncbi:MAG: hypothetical protein WCP74_05930 [Sphingobacteriia bacterium]|jgi:hypothetical protein